jgi:hypothetical protein
MRLFLYVIIVSIIFSIGAAPSFAQTSQQFAVKDTKSGKSFTVNYNIKGGIIDDILISHQDTSLVIALNSSSDGNLTVTMPRALIDAKLGTNDDDFFVLVDGADTDFHETKTTADRTITVSFPESTNQIEVIGTQVVPEFGGLSFLVLIMAIFSMVAISSIFRLKSR